MKRLSVALCPLRALFLYTFGSCVRAARKSCNFYSSWGSTTDFHDRSVVASGTCFAPVYLIPCTVHQSVTFYCMNLATALFAGASPRVLKLPSSSFLHPRVMSLLSVLRRWASTAFVTHSLLRLRNPLLLRWKLEEEIY